MAKTALACKKKHGTSPANLPTAMPLGLLLILLYLGSIGLLTAAVFSLLAMRRARGFRRPVKERMLRPAGTSLTEQLSGLGGSAVLWFTMAVFIPMAMAGAIIFGNVWTITIPSAKSLTE